MDMQAPVTGIKSRFKLNYPSYKLDIKFDVINAMYLFTVYKGSENLGGLTFIRETPIDEVWGNLIEWMRHIVR